MRTLLKKLWNDENGFIVSAELAVIATAGVLATVVGLNKVASSVNHELNDVSNAIGALDQSYCYSGFCNPGHACVSGSAYLDTQDECDCAVMINTHTVAKVDGNRGFERGHRGHHKRGEFHKKDRYDKKGPAEKGRDKKSYKEDHKRKHDDKEAHRHHHHGGHGHEHGTHFRHGGTRILRSENGRPLFIDQQQCCPLHPRTVLPCEKCKEHQHYKGKPTLAPKRSPKRLLTPAKPKLKKKPVKNI